MYYIERQNKCGIKEGDKVRVIRKVSDMADGWQCTWEPRMDDCVGKEFIVLKDRGEVGFRLDTLEMCEFFYAFPYFVLELVTETESIKSDIIQSIMDEEKSNVISCSSCAHGHLPSSDPMCAVYGECPNYQEK